MRLLFLGDVVGRAGRDAVKACLPAMRNEYTPDAIVLNADNAAGGFGVTPQLCSDFRDMGVDVITGGDHIWDQKEMRAGLERQSYVLRPHNFPDTAPGRGVTTIATAKGQRLAVIHLLGQVFHKEYLNCPFACVDAVLKELRLGHEADAIMVDMHAEATSEKNAMGVYLDGRVSAVLGSHTHVPTADARILPGGTAYHTDTGMCGDYQSVIGFDSKAPLAQFTTKVRKQRMQPASGEGTCCATFVETGENGLASRIIPIIRGGVLGYSSSS